MKKFFKLLETGKGEEGREKGERKVEKEERRVRRTESREKIAEKRQQRGERVKTEVATLGGSSFCLSANCVKIQRSSCFL